MEYCRKGNKYDPREINYYFKHHIGIDIPKKFLPQFMVMINSAKYPDDIIRRFFIYLATIHRKS